MRFPTAFCCISVLTALAGVAEAAISTQTGVFAGIPNLSGALTFSSFDTSLGTLNSVTITADLEVVGGNAFADNESGSAANVTVEFGANAIISSSDVFFSPLTATATDSGNFFLTPDDGDGSGVDPTPTDGVTFSPSGSFDSATIAITNPVNLTTFTDSFIGATYDIDYLSTTFLNITGASGVAGGFDPASVYGSVTVKYDYSPGVVPEPSSILVFAGLAFYGWTIGSFSRQKA